MTDSNDDIIKANTTFFNGNYVSPSIYFTNVQHISIRYEFICVVFL